VAATLLAAPATSSARVPDPVRLQALVDELVAAGAPGAVLHVRDADDDWSGASGLSDIATANVMGRRSRFRVGSLTKSYVATVALQLVEEDRLALTDTLERHLPGTLPYGSRVTVRHLLQHRSGVPDYLAVAPLGDYPTAGPGRLRVWTPAELVGLVAGRPAAFEPGTAWGYSNTNFVLLGLIIERVTRRALGAEIDRRFLRPLALDDTFFPMEPRLPTPRSRGYAPPLGPDGQPTAGPLVEVSSFDPSIVWGAANMIADVDDVGDFYGYLLDGRFLSEGLLTEMKQAQPTGVPGVRYGLGLMVSDLPCGPAFGHDGDVFGFSTVALGSEDATRQVVLFVNVSPAPRAVLEAARRVAATAYCATVPPPEPPAPPPPPPPPLASAALGSG
jgi:D-alanyl-D-alanine carboxypeptidase